MIHTDGMVMIGNFSKARRYKNGRPKNPDRDYKAIVPYDLKWRAKLGKVECDCKEMIEAYQPYYGFTLFHGPDCAIRKHLKKYPQMQNFLWERDPAVIAQSE